MIFTETRLSGAFTVDLEPLADNRGFFARGFCQREFEARGLSLRIAQMNLSFSRDRGTVRGLHFQFPPAAEAKLVRCIRGALVDVIVDLRPHSPTYLEHVAIELTAENRSALYIPEQFAHGYQVCEDNTEILYQVGEFYTPSAEGGLRYSDPRLAIQWPLPVSDISDKDRSWPLLEHIEPDLRRRLTRRAGDVSAVAPSA